MPDQPDSPVAAYLRQLDSRLRDLPPARRAAIRRELLAHLEDAADEQGVDPGDPHVQQRVLAALGPAELLAAQFGQVHGGLVRALRRAAFACGLLGGALGVLIAPVASGMLDAASPRTVAWLLAFLAAGWLGLSGVIRHEREQPGGTWRLIAAIAVLTVPGLFLLYEGSGSLDGLGGLGLILAGELLLIALVVNGSVRQLPRSALVSLISVALGLVSFVSPCSALPNPLGAYYLLAGGYRYDPASVFVNRFATLWDGNPSALVTARLTQLIGQTGLTPLDPQHPLTGYTVQRVETGGRTLWSRVIVELRFADGQTRTVAIPARDSPAGRLTAIDRLTAPHRPVPGLPPATGAAPARLGLPAPLSLAPAAEALTLTAFRPPFGATLRWAPDRRTVLVLATGERQTAHEPARGLWLVPLDGGAPRLLAEDALDGLWSPDGRTVIALLPQGITAIDAATGVWRALGKTDRSDVAVVDTEVFFLNAGVLWRVPLAGGDPQRITALADAGAILDRTALAVSPDGQRIAYRCLNDLCLAERGGRLLARLGLGLQALPDPNGAIPIESFFLSWSPDGQRLALATASIDWGGPPTLRLLTRDGQVTTVVGLGPDGPLGAPQWFPDGRRLLLTTYPWEGRRIVAVDAVAGAAYDLTQPRWDAFGSLSADGTTVLLWNGRGGLWAAPLGAGRDQHPAPVEEVIR